MNIFNLLVVFAVMLFVSGCKSSSNLSDSNNLPDSNKNVQADGNGYVANSNKKSYSSKDSYSSNGANSNNSPILPSASPARNSGLPNSSHTDSSISMSEEEKYKLFYAASESADGSLVLLVSQKIGLYDAENRPAPNYTEFWEGYIKWTSKDKSFAKTLNTKEKAKDYISSRLQLK